MGVEEHAAPLQTQEHFDLLLEPSLEAEGHVAPLHPEENLPTDTCHAGSIILSEKPKSKWTRKIYLTSAVQHSGRIKFARKFQDEK